MSVVSSHDIGANNKKTYLIGFGLSLTLTLIAFGLVELHVAHRHAYPADGFLMVALLGLAVVQLFVQLVCFLHIRRGSSPRWNVWTLAAAVTVVIILVIGSMWIMSSLNYRMKYSSPQINQYLKAQDRL